MNIIIFIIYNLIFVPIFFVLCHLGAIFNQNPLMVVHCASMGEFEHIKPFLVQFKKARPDFRIIVLFFSPSGYKNIQSFPCVDLFLYAPFDWFLPVFRFMIRLKPTLWVIAKHDVWPNQVWFANWLKIPLFLINASLHSKYFHRILYSRFTKILTISENDQSNFLKLVPSEKILLVGDTKFDQVIYRRNESKKLTYLPERVTSNRWIFIAGSTWPEDHKHLLPAVKKLSEKHQNFFTIICPHEPTPKHLDELTKNLQPLKSILLSNIQNYSNESVLIIDKIGILANIYGLGKVAYVGGSFKQNVHNVLEAAVYAIPVLIGPVNSNSNEAQLLKAAGGCFEVKNSTDIFNFLEKFFINDIYRRESGVKAFRIVKENCGATELSVQTILSYLENHS